MNENRDQPKEGGTCHEGSPCAGMMRTVPGEEGIGGLCEEMMRSVAETRRTGGEGLEDAREREAGEQEKDPGPQAAPNEDKDHETGGIR